MKILIRIVLIVLFVFVIWRLFFHDNASVELEDTGIWTDTIPKNYAQLLKLADSSSKDGSIVFVNTLSCKYRKPVSRFYIDNKYYLQVYKMDTSFKYSLKNAIKESYSNSSDYSLSNTTYHLDNRTDLEFLYKRTKPHKPKDIYLNLLGDSTRILEKNDTLAYYYSKCVNLSIKFSPKDENDIYGKCKSESLNEIPLEIMFVKRDANLYMLVLSSKKAGTSLTPGILNNLLLKANYPVKWRPRDKSDVDGFLGN